MNAIILAAGEGSRLRPLTLEHPKCLIEYQGKPLIDYQLEALRNLGIQKIILVKGYKAESVSRPGVLTVSNPDYATTNMVYSLFCAEKYFDDDLIVSYGDIIYEKSILEALIQSDSDFSVTVSLNWKELWERRMQDPLSDAETLKLDGEGNIRELGKKPCSYDEIQGQYMGLLKILQKFLPTVQSVYHHLDPQTLYEGRDLQNMFMTTFIQILIDRGYPVKAVPVTGEWLEVDRLEDLKVVCRI